MCVSSSPIKSISPAAPGKTILKCGLFPQIPRPEAESFATERQMWEKAYEGVQQYKAGPFKSERLDA